MMLSMKNTSTRIFLVPLIISGLSSCANKVVVDTPCYLNNSISYLNKDKFQPEEGMQLHMIFESNARDVESKVQPALSEYRYTIKRPDSRINAEDYFFAHWWRYYALQTKVSRKKVDKIPSIDDEFVEKLFGGLYLKRYEIGEGNQGFSISWERNIENEESYVFFENFTLNEKGKKFECKANPKLYCSKTYYKGSVLPIKGILLLEVAIQIGGQYSGIIASSWETVADLEKKLGYEVVRIYRNSDYMPTVTKNRKGSLSSSCKTDIKACFTRSDGRFLISFSNDARNAFVINKDKVKKTSITISHGDIVILDSGRELKR